MDHILKWGPPPSKISYLKLFLFLVLVCVSNCSSGTPHLNKAVKDMAILSCDYNISTLELTNMRIYWQKQQKNMVLTVINGYTKVWKEYENRTFAIFNNNHSIVIVNLRLSDNGTYDCIIQKPDESGSYRVKHRASVKLLVNAYFPVPDITDLGSLSPKSRRIRCSTSGGFPKPQLTWLENEEELNASNMTVSQDTVTKLYTISSELDFNVTSNHSFICLVKYGDLKVSQTFTWQKFMPDPDQSSQPWHNVLFALLTVVVFILVILVFRLGRCWVYRHIASQRGGRRNAENMEMRGISPSTPEPANHQIA